MAAVACGTASYACLVGKYWFESLAGLPVDWDIASEFRYREPPLARARSGCSSRSPARPPTRWRPCATCARPGTRRWRWSTCPRARSRARPTALLRTLAGPEIGVASTKAFTTQLATLACLAIGAARARGRLTPEREEELTQALDELPARILQVLEKDQEIRAIAQELDDRA